VLCLRRGVLGVGLLSATGHGWCLRCEMGPLVAGRIQFCELLECVGVGVPEARLVVACSIFSSG